MVVTPERRAPQTDLGTALRMAWWSYVRRIDMEMDSQGFPDRVHSMNYVFALYAQPRPISISEMGRLFAISRQAASKIVAELKQRGYVRATESTTDQREKVVELTPKAMKLVNARLSAAAAQDRAIRDRLGDQGFDDFVNGLKAVLEVAHHPAKSGRGSPPSGKLDPADFYRSPKLWWS